jgi:hypothetical protein
LDQAVAASAGAPVLAFAHRLNNMIIEYGDDETDSSFAILDVRGKKQLTVWTSKARKTRLPAKADFVAWTDDKTVKLASSGQEPVFLIQAADGSWSVSKTPN